MATSDCFVSVVAPLYNDSDIVEAFMKDILGVLRREYANYELVLIDDGSTDNTVEIVTSLLTKYECVRLIRLSRRFGQETAILAGLDSVIGDFVVVMLPDSDPPEQVPHMVERSRAGVGVVYGVRRDRKGDPLYLRIGSRLFYWLFNRLVGIKLPRNSRDFRVFSRQTVNAITGIKDRFRYLRVFSSYVGYGNESFIYDPIQRRSKPRVKGFFQAVRIAFGMIVANSTHPLRLVSLLGLVMSGLSLLHIVYVLVIYMLYEDIAQGWATRSLHSSVMFLFLFLILAALCEYVGRLIHEVKDRPPYYVMEEKNSSVVLANEERKNVVTESTESQEGR